MIVEACYFMWYIVAVIITSHWEPYSMEIIVCIKQVPGTTSVNIDPETGILLRDGIDAKMNPFDLFALETAFMLREKMGGSVKVITMGPPQARGIVMESYMMGADDGFLVTDKSFAGSDVLATSYTLSQGIKKMGKFDLVICGKQTTDGDTAQVGPEIAEFLDIPHVSNVLKINKITDRDIVIDMDMPETIETLSIKFPCLISVDKDIYQPRLPSYLLKQKTKEKEVKKICLKDLIDSSPSNYGLEGSPTQVERVFPPEHNSNKEIWNGSSDEMAKRVAKKLKDLKFI